MIQIDCPNCQQSHRLDPASDARRVVCRCGQTLEIPFQPGAIDTGLVACTCQRQLRVLRSDVGKAVQCPCGSLVDIDDNSFVDPSTIHSTAPVVNDSSMSDILSQFERTSPNDDFSLLERERQNAITLDNSARASNPGNITVSSIQWIRHYPFWPILWISLLLLPFIPAVFVHGSFLFLVFPSLAMNALYWQRVSEHFRHGCANPAVIISVNPMRFAVSTDLTKGIGEFPVIKIIEKELKSVNGAAPQVGTQFATVALYFPSPDSTPHWSDFDPRPVDAATGDPEQIAKVMSSFDDGDWLQLREWLELIPQPHQPGLFHVPNANAGF